MRKVYKGISRLILSLSLVLFVSGMIPKNLFAEEAGKSYLITYRAGDVGRFNVSQYQANHTDCKLVDSSAYYMTFQVSENAPYPDIPTESSGEIVIENADSGSYYVTSWGPQGTKVTKSEEYVVDYGKLFDPTTYTVYYYYKNSAGKDIEIANALYDAKGNVGEEIAIAKSISGYRFDHMTRVDQSTEFALSADAAKNIFYIYYVLDSDLSGVDIEHAGGGTRTEYVDGEQVVVSVPGTTTIVGGGNQTVQTGDANAQAVAQANTANVVNGDNTGNDQNTVTIDDDQVALNENIEQNAQNDQTEQNQTSENVQVEIEDELVPKIDANMGVVHNYVPIYITAGVIALGACVVAVLLHKRKNAKLKSK